VTLSNLLKTTPETLAIAQYAALKTHAISVLEDVIKKLKADDIKAVKAMTYYSPAGDCMGTDSTCINFLYGEPDTSDFGDLLDNLERLNSISLGNKKN